jgi:hypothetical protein
MTILPDGTYVRFAMAPNTRLGTVSGGKIDGSGVKYVFHHDKRIRGALKETPYVHDFDIEVCERPSDAEIATINELIKRGGG